MGDIRLYCLVLLVLSGKTRQLLGRFREFDEHLVADDAHRILLQFCVLGFNPGARLCVELPKMFCTSDYFTIKGALAKRDVHMWTLVLEGTDCSFGRDQEQAVVSARDGAASNLKCNTRPGLQCQWIVA